MKLQHSTPCRVWGIACAFALSVLACLPEAFGQSPQPQLYWTEYVYDAPTDRFSLHRANLDGTQAVELNRSVRPEPWLGMTVYDGKLLWGSDVGTMHAATIAGEELGPWNQPLPPGVRAEALGMAYDAATGATFRTVSSPTGDQNVERVEATGDVTTLISTEVFPANLALAIDPVNRKLYFGGYADGRGVIRRANLDGTGVEDVIADLALDPQPFDLALDPLGGRMYWTVDLTGRLGKIQRANLDGSGVQDVVSVFSPGRLALDVVVPEPAAGVVPSLLAVALLRRRQRRG